MPQFYTDPSITMRGLREPDTVQEMLARFMQLRQFGEESRFNKVRQEEASLRLDELKRIQREQKAVRAAQAAGVRPPAIPGGAYTSDRNAMVAELARGEPHLVAGAQSQFAQEDFTQQEQRQKLVKTRLENIATQVGLMGSMARSVLDAPESARPQIYASVRAQAIQRGFLRPEEAPEQFTPDVLPWIEQQANQAMTVAQIVKAQQDKIEEAGRAERYREPKPVAGRDVPLPVDVEAQRKRMRQPERTSAQHAAAERWKSGQLRTLKAEAARRQQAVERGEPNAEAMSEEEFRNSWQEIQNSYEDQLGSAEHLDITLGQARQNLPGRGGSPQATLRASKGKLSVAQASEYLRRAGGDKDRARAQARADGWEF